MIKKGFILAILTAFCIVGFQSLSLADGSSDHFHFEFTQNGDDEIDWNLYYVKVKFSQYGGTGSFEFEVDQPESLMLKSVLTSKGWGRAQIKDLTLHSRTSQRIEPLRISWQSDIPPTIVNSREMWRLDIGTLIGYDAIEYRYDLDEDDITLSGGDVEVGDDGIARTDPIRINAKIVMGTGQYRGQYLLGKVSDYGGVETHTIRFQFHGDRDYNDDSDKNYWERKRFDFTSEAVDNFINDHIDNNDNYDGPEIIATIELRIVEGVEYMHKYIDGRHKRTARYWRVEQETGGSYRKQDKLRYTRPPDTIYIRDIRLNP